MLRIAFSSGAGVWSRADLGTANTMFTTTDPKIKANAEHWAQAVMSGDLDAFERLVTWDIVDHDAAPEQAGGGPEGFKAFFSMLRAAFSDLKLSVEHTVGREKELALAYTIEGTHTGMFAGIPPTAKHIKVRGMQIAKYDDDGMMIERWGSSDELGILKQIGARISA